MLRRGDQQSPVVEKKIDSNVANGLSSGDHQSSVVEKKIDSNVVNGLSSGDQQSPVVEKKFIQMSQMDCARTIDNRPHENPNNDGRNRKGRDSPRP
jgi:uncharacterized protein YoaH (UPF0181 family)